MLEGKRILIVDDEYMIALMAEELVRDLGGIPVGPVSTWKEAMQVARSGDFDAALLDVNLNGTQSEAVARELLARNIPFVVVTGYGAVDWTGITAPVLMKPYDGPAIARALAKSIAARNSD
jgi:CheY-like chemotaxis protein